ncbi:MAG: VOC family protein [Actinomycetota bacterium]
MAVDGTTPLRATAIAALEGLDDWTYVLESLQAGFAVADFGSAAALAGTIVDAADAADHHPDIDLRYPGVLRISLKTHAVGMVTMRDVELARTISALAAEAEATLVERPVQQLEIAIDTVDMDRIRPFWQAVLDYDYIERAEALVDPRRQGPLIWFQTLDPPRTDRNRIHFDITVPPAEAEGRVAAAVAAGGTLVSDARAKAFWVLADAEGNEVCVCTWQDRD